MSVEDVSIKKNMEETFDIPFHVTKEIACGEPVFYLSPEDPGKEMFIVRVSFRNRIRLVMDFLPQKYSVNFIRAMGHQSNESRSLFRGYIQEIKRKGAKCTIKVNGSELNLMNDSEWPESWNSFEARVTKMPVHTDEDFIYKDIINEWGSLMLGMILSLTDIVPVESEMEQTGYREGESKKIQVNKYERSLLNRKLCLAAKGYNCTVCGMNFEETYGEIGDKFIHVHHIVPVSQMGAEYIVNPVTDLIPVCPNCHAMLHKNDPPYMPEQIRKMIENRREQLYDYKDSCFPKALAVAEKRAHYGDTDTPAHK